MASETSQAVSDDFASVTSAVMRNGPPRFEENLDGMALDNDPWPALKSRPERAHIA